MNMIPPIIEPIITLILVHTLLTAGSSQIFTFHITPSLSTAITSITILFLLLLLYLW